ncbi:nitroreductase family protein [Lentzea sp. BCCO 10_0061]|uniref:Nitroreductase family protein n=1 Tax=Lentzea sokolovensis TaxID=3095429 RepID=A0ABU4UPX7_9PSEU|nr:nitroreductase family protein [Lentzea sp. BCCO 10_0061]MDX8141548.1 nitroreductase family protein [Lentzea sp. BCCO 10_0061]
MDRGRPDENTLRAAVALACRAPSVHNSQPWRWELGEHSLHLYADRARNLPAVDPLGADLTVSCGAALHHLRVGLAALGWRTVVHRLPNPGMPDHLAAIEFEAHEPTESQVAHAAAIPRRRTDRRAFSSWSVPDGILDQLVACARAEGVDARVVTGRARDELLIAIGKAAAAQEADPQYRAEIREWSGVYPGASAGVPAANIPAGSRQYGDLRMREFAPGELLQSGQKLLSEDAGSLLVLNTSSDDELSRLRAGEATSAVLLEATAAGLATCPISQPLEVVETRELVRDQVLGGSTCPQLVIRVGWAAFNADPLPATPRRPVIDVLSHQEQP